LLGIFIIAAFLRLWMIADLPPGLFHDEAAEGVDAVHILSSGARPAFLPANNGREPAFAYFVAIVFSIIGPGALGLRLAAALLGLATVPLAYTMARRLFGPTIGMLAALFLAISPWHIHLSRLGVRPVALPLLEALAFFLLWKAYQSGRLLWWFLSGVVFGATLYTYMPARLLLGLVLLPMGVTIWRRQGGWRRWLLGPVVLVVALLVSALPLATYFYQHPEDFIERAHQVSFMNAVRAGADPMQTSLDHLQATLGMFLFQGDTNPRHNLPGKPIFDPFLGLLAVTGLGLSLIRIKHLEYLVLVGWLIIALIPAIVSDSAPHFLRAAGLLPTLMVLPAIGLSRIWAMIQRWPGRFRLPSAAILLVGITCGFILGARDYFLVWPAITSPAFQVDRTELIGYGSAQPETTRVYYATREPDDPLVALLARRPVIIFHPESLPIRQTTEPDALFLVPQTEGALACRISQLFPTGLISGNTTGGGRWFMAPAGVSPTFTLPQNSVEFGDRIRLIGSVVPSEVGSGDDLAFTVVWQWMSAMKYDLALVVFLRGKDGEIWRQGRQLLGLGIRSSSKWSLDEVVVEERRLGVPADITPGTYDLIVALEPATGGQRMDAVDESGALIGNQLVLGTTTVRKEPGPPNLAMLPIAQRVSHDFNGALRLLGYNQGLGVLKQGDELRTTLFWQAISSPMPEYLIRLVLKDGSGLTVISSQGAPVGGQYSSSNWSYGEVVRDYRRLLVGGATPPGTYTLWLEVSDGEAIIGQPIRLSTIVVEERPRQMVTPAIPNRLEVNLGESLQLLGYDLPDTLASGKTFPVTLYWRSRAATSASYTVFVHLLDVSQKVVAQHDGIPLYGRSPTSGWLPGEIIADIHELRIPPGLLLGKYLIEVGMYDALNGQRLPVSSGDDASQNIDPVARRILLARPTLEGQ
jgi:4-amino-4-deoxy-L-arabinose transferase-like glycosyltransferase